MKDNQITLFGLTLKTIVVHTVTYTLVGLLALNLFDYATQFAETDLRMFMRPIDDPLIALGPGLQPLRGIQGGVEEGSAHAELGEGRHLILHEGEIVREGTPADVWADPGSAFVAGFLGLGNIIEGKVRGKRKEGGWQIESDAGTFDIRCDDEHREGQTVHLLARPLPAEGDALSLRGAVTDVIFQQDRFKVTLDNDLYVYLSESPAVGEEIDVQVKVECLA